MAVDHSEYAYPDESAEVASAAATSSRLIKQLLIHSNLDPGTTLALVDIPPRMKAARLEAVLVSIWAGEVPRDLRGLRVVAEQLEERFATELASGDIETVSRRVLRRIADLFGGVLGFGACYIVLGGLVGGDSDLLHGLPGAVALLLFLVLAIVLAIVEALHVAGTQLRYLSLDGLLASHPRTVLVHRWIRSQRGIDAFLSGRQLIVIVTVFLLAQVTSMSRMTTWPFTSIALPAFVHFLVKLGLPGAFVLLWGAQLMPQFFATRRTLWLTNTRVAVVFVRVAGFLDEMGFARFGHWGAAVLTARASSEPRIPSSAALRWTQVADDEVGYAIVDQVRKLHIGPDAVTLSLIEGLAVRGEHVGLVPQTATLAAPPRAFSTTSYLLRDGQEQTLSTTQTALPAAAKDGIRLLQLVSTPVVGSFRRGDEVRTLVSAEFAAEYDSDAVFVDGVTRFLLWELELTAPPRSFPPLTITTYALGGGFDERVPIGEPVYLEPSPTTDGGATLTHRIDHPTPNTLIVLSWEVDW